jgi:hypothetical protein
MENSRFAPVPLHARQRSVRGLGEPNLPRTYSAEERAARWDLVTSLRAQAECGGESHIPLWPFFGVTAHAKMERKRPTLEGRRFWERFAEGAFPSDDPTVASIPGIQARDVYEARLSRLCFVAMVTDIAQETLADSRREPCTWETMDFLPAIYPYSARAWEPATLAEATYDAAIALAERLARNDAELFTCIADRMIFSFAAEQHARLMEAKGLEVPFDALDELFLDNADFLLLFDPAWDGIEDDALAVGADLDICGPFAWFGSEMWESVTSQLAK